jgi:hypothetical protein
MITSGDTYVWIVAISEPGNDTTDEWHITQTQPDIEALEEVNPDKWVHVILITDPLWIVALSNAQNKYLEGLPTDEPARKVQIKVIEPTTR